MHPPSASANSVANLAEANADRASCRAVPGRAPVASSGRRHAALEQCHAGQRVDQAIAHMVRHLDQPLRIATLSSVAGVSASHFFSLFKAVTGQSPIEYFIHLRMQRACEVLQEQQLKIEEVAARLGYHDPYYFSRLFKQVIGQAPSAYRRTPVNSASNCSGPVVARLAPARQPEPAAFD